MEQALDDREKRAEVLSDRLGAMQGAVAQNSERVSVLKSELESLNESRTEWLQEVHRVGESQKAVQAQSRAANEQLAELRALTVALEQKRAELSATEQRISKHEERLAKLENVLGTLDHKIAEVGQKQSSVDQVKQQVDTLFEATEQTRNDAMKVLEARQDVLETGKRLELLLREASVLNSKYEGLEKRTGAIDDASAKMDHLQNVISDVEGNLENLKEQRTVVDHIAEKIARLDFALQRAEAATRELREERALASRIYKSMQQQKGAPQDASQQAQRAAKAGSKPS
jgi:exonuclease SbcC